MYQLHREGLEAQRWDGRACSVCGRSHRSTPVCCYECGDSGGKRHSFACEHGGGRRAAFDIEVRHEVVSDPGGARWQHGKIERVAKVRQRFMRECGLISVNDPTTFDALVTTDFDALLMVDSDVILGPGVLKRMWEVDADVVFGCFWTYCDWGGSMDHWPQVYDINPYGWYPETAAALRAPGVNEVEVLGGGACTLIRGRGFKSRYWPLLKSLQPYQNMFCGEDRSYCLGLEARGIRQIAVTGLPIRHCYSLADQTKPALERIRQEVGL